MALRSIVRLLKGSAIVASLSAFPAHAQQGPLNWSNGWSFDFAIAGISTYCEYVSPTFEFGVSTDQSGFSPLRIYMYKQPEEINKFSGGHYLPLFNFRNTQSGAIYSRGGVAEGIRDKYIYKFPNLPSGTYELTISWREPYAFNNPTALNPRTMFNFVIPPFHSSGGRGTGCAFN